MQKLLECSHNCQTNRIPGGGGESGGGGVNPDKLGGGVWPTPKTLTLAILKDQSIDSLFFSHYYQIYKEAAFGRLNYNLCLLDGYTPSMFSNGVPHENQKTFLMQICKIAQQSKIFETSVKLVKEYCTIWQNAGNVAIAF